MKRNENVNPFKDKINLQFFAKDQEPQPEPAPATEPNPAPDPAPDPEPQLSAEEQI